MWFDRQLKITFKKTPLFLPPPLKIQNVEGPPPFFANIENSPPPPPPLQKVGGTLWQSHQNDFEQIPYIIMECWSWSSKLR